MFNTPLLRPVCCIICVILSLWQNKYNKFMYGNIGMDNAEIEIWSCGETGMDFNCKESFFQLIYINTHIQIIF